MTSSSENNTPVEPIASTSTLISTEINQKTQKRSRDSTSTSDVQKKTSTSSRRIDSVVFAGYEIQAEFHSPYPFEEPAITTATNSASTSGEKKGSSSKGGGGSNNKSLNEINDKGSNKKSKGNGHVKVEQSSSINTDKGKRKESPLVPKNNNDTFDNTTTSITNDIDLTEALPSTINLASRVPVLPPRSSPLSISNLLNTSNSDPTPIHRTRRTSSSSTPSTSRSIRKDSPMFTSNNSSPHPPATLLSANSPSTSTINLPSTSSIITSTDSRPTTRRKSLQDAELASSNFIGVNEEIKPNLKKGKGKGKAKMEEFEMDVDEKVIPSGDIQYPQTSTSKPESITASSNSKKNIITFAPNTLSTSKTGGVELPKTRRLFVCDFCFKYMLQGAACTAHMKQCTYKHPPGRIVYNRGAHTIWEIDGATAKLYCQNLCLFAKLFIEHKYMFFDVEGFLFYVITDATPSHDYVLGYFSKEKMSYDDYNLACIVTFPPFQKQAWGSLLIEFSYELTRLHSSTPGTPERPLSELGLKGYLTYWTSTLVRYFRSVFESRIPIKEVLSISNGDSEAQNDQIEAKEEEGVNGSGKKSKKVKNISTSNITNGTTPTPTPTLTIKSTPILDQVVPGLASPNSTTLTLRRSANGFASASFQPPSSPVTTPSSIVAVDETIGKDSTVEVDTTSTNSGWARPEVQSLRFVLKRSSRNSTPVPNSNSTTVNKGEEEVKLPIVVIETDPNKFTFKTGLQEIAEAVNLKVEDVAFALVESGLASWRRRERKDTEDEANVEGVVMEHVNIKNGIGGEEVKDLDEIVISLDLVEEVAKKFKVKAPLLDRTYVKC